MRNVDVLIIGGGPAGLAAGIVFAHSGFETVVCEQKRFPVDKVCGEGILPPGVGHLKSLGVAKFIRTEDFRQLRGIMYRSHEGDEAYADFQKAPGWGMSRLTLSSAFQARISEFGTLEVNEGGRARILGRQGGQVLVECDGEVYATRLLVGADGKDSQVRKWAGLEGSPPSLWRWGIRQHFHLTPWSDYVEVHWRPGNEAYITPCGEQMVGFTFLVNREHLRRHRSDKSLLHSLIDAFPLLRERLEGKRPVDSPIATGPMQRLAKATIADGVILIGDAAGYLDAITGDGISLALAQALALKHTVVPVLQEKGRKVPIFSQDLETYAGAHRATVKLHYRMTNLVLLLARYPPLSDRAIAFLSKNPALFRLLLSLSLGRDPYPN